MGPPLRKEGESMAKWLWKRHWELLTLDSPARSISRRVVKWVTAIPTPKERLWDKIQKLIMFMIPTTGSGSGFGGRGTHNGYDFWDR